MCHFFSWLFCVILVTASLLCHIAGFRLGAVGASLWLSSCPSPSLLCWCSSGCWLDTGFSWMVRHSFMTVVSVCLQVFHSPEFSAHDEISLNCRTILCFTWLTLQKLETSKNVSWVVSEAVFRPNQAVWWTTAEVCGMFVLQNVTTVKRSENMVLLIWFTGFLITNSATAAHSPLFLQSFFKPAAQSNYTCNIWTKFDSYINLIVGYNWPPQRDVGLCSSRSMTLDQHSHHMLVKTRVAKMHYASTKEWEDAKVNFICVAPFI